MKTVYSLLFFLILLGSQAYGQLIIDTTANASQLAQKLVGTGVTVSNPVLTCSPSSSGKFTNGGSTQLGISDGIILTNGVAIQIDSAYDFFADTDMSFPGDQDLTNLLVSSGAASTTTFDGCVLEFDVNPLGDTLAFTYVFASEEYQDFTCSTFTDVFGFFISGAKPGGGNYVSQNIAIIPGTNLPVSINSVNGGMATDTSVDTSEPCLSLAYSNYFVWDSTICYSGSTIPLQAKAAVLPCHTYHLKLAVADVTDGFLDTGVFIEGGSLTSSGLPDIKSVLVDGGLSDPVRGCAKATVTVRNKPTSSTPLVVHLRIGGTAINGTDYSHLSDSIIFPANDSIATITISPLSYLGAQSNKTVTIYLLSGACGGGAYDSITVTIVDSLVFHAGPDQNICQGNSVTLSATGVPSCVWSPASTLSSSTVLNPVAHPIASTMYVASFTVGVCTVKDSTLVSILPPSNGGPDDTVCINTPAMLSATGSGIWSVPGGNPVAATIVSPNNPNTLVNGLTTAGLYSFVWAAVGGCPDTVHVFVKPGPVLLVSNASICPGGTATITASPSQSGGTFSWSPGGEVTPSITVSPTSTTVYSVTYVLPASTCGTITAFDTVAVHPLPTLSVNDPRICAGASAVLTATPSFIGGSYSWSPVAGNTQSITVSPFSNTTYTVVYTMTGCASVTDSGTVTIGAPEFSDSITNATCYGVKNGHIAISAPTCIGCSYQWSNGTSGINLDNVSAGTYTLTVTDQSGCKTTASYVVQQPANATLSVFPSDTSVVENTPVFLTSMFGYYPASSIISYNWSPSAGLSCTDCPQPLFNYGSGNYTYSLVITYNDNCIIRDTVKVMVVNQHIIYVPNSFTPNGDGVNDIFQLYSHSGIKYLNLTIFNRWGEKVFETEDQGRGWDGRFKNQMQEPGIFVYALRITFDDNYSTTLKGSISLIR